MAADYVPRDLLVGMSPEPESVAAALGVLASYSMITLTGRTMATHRLVQTVVADQASTTDAWASTLHRTCDLITQRRPTGDPQTVVEEWPAGPYSLHTSRHSPTDGRPMTPTLTWRTCSLGPAPT